MASTAKTKRAGIKISIGRRFRCSVQFDEITGRWSAWRGGPIGSAATPDGLRNLLAIRERAHADADGFDAAPVDPLDAYRHPGGAGWWWGDRVTLTVADWACLSFLVGRSTDLQASTAQARGFTDMIGASVSADVLRRGGHER